MQVRHAEQETPAHIGIVTIGELCRDIELIRQRGYETHLRCPDTCL